MAQKTRRPKNLQKFCRFVFKIEIYNFCRNLFCKKGWSPIFQFLYKQNTEGAINILNQYVWQCGLCMSEPVTAISR